MTKYNWAIVPSEVEFLATDSNGCVFGYDAEPVEKGFREIYAHLGFPVFSTQ